MGIKMHEKTIAAKSAIVDYNSFSTTRIIVDRHDPDSIMIAAIFRAGEIYVLRWYPTKDKNQTGKLWRYNMQTAYDTIPVTFGVYRGNSTGCEENCMDSILSNIAAYDGPAITPRDASGFIRIRVRRGNHVSYDPGVNSGRISIENHAIKIPNVELRVNRVSKDDDAAIGIVTFIHVMGERVTARYTDDQYRGIFDHLFSPFDYDEETGLAREKAAVIGKQIDQMLDEVSKPLDLDRSTSTELFEYLGDMFCPKNGYNPIRHYHRLLYNAILPPY